MTDPTCRAKTPLALALAFACLPLMAPFTSAQGAEGSTGASARAAPRRYRYDTKRSIVYATAGGEKLLLDTYVPQAPGQVPAVLVVHGGAWRMGNKQQLSSIARALAASGTAAFAINYRLAPKHKFPAQIEDCRSAIRWIVDNASKYKVDPTRLGAIGYSAGGHLVALLGAQGVEHANGRVKRLIRLKAVAAGGAPCEFRHWPPDAGYLTYWLGGTPRQKPQAYRNASPTAFVTSSSSPVFFYHGEKDRLVRPAAAQAMATALKKAGVDTQFHVVKGAGHIPAAVNRTAIAEALKFLAKYLAPKDDKKSAARPKAK